MLEATAATLTLFGWMVTGYVWMVTGEPLFLHFFNQQKTPTLGLISGSGKVPGFPKTAGSLLPALKILRYSHGFWGKESNISKMVAPLWQLHLLTKQNHSLFQVAPDSPMLFPGLVFGEAFVSSENTQRIPNGQQKKRRSNRKHPCTMGTHNLHF